MRGVLIGARHALRLALALALTGASLTGCGGDADGGHPAKATSGPRPVETPEQATARIATAARKGDCSNPGAIFYESAVTQSLCRRLLPPLVPAPPPNVKGFGSAAVLRTAAGEKAVLALDSERRYKVAFSFSGTSAVAPAVRADPVADFAIAAIRRGSCADILKVSFTYSPGGTGRKFCALAPVRKLHAALEGDRTAKPVALGGDGSFAFYALNSGRSGYFTLVFEAQEDGRYLFVTSLAA